MSRALFILLLISTVNLSSCGGTQQEVQLPHDLENFVAPLSRLSDRPILKPFGIRISPNDSPIQPERFSGYHTGTDFEIFEEERTQPVSVVAICGGKLRSKQMARGYGGVAVQECLLGEE